jgi:hypothetical protein
MEQGVADSVLRDAASSRPARCWPGSITCAVLAARLWFTRQPRLGHPQGVVAVRAAHPPRRPRRLHPPARRRDLVAPGLTAPAGTRRVLPDRPAARGVLTRCAAALPGDTPARMTVWDLPRPPSPQAPERKGPGRPEGQDRPDVVVQARRVRYVGADAQRVPAIALLLLGQGGLHHSSAVQITPYAASAGLSLTGRPSDRCRRY